MKVAVSTSGRNITSEIGDNVKFAIFNIVQGRAKGKLLVDVSACGDSNALCYILRNEQVEVLLCDKIEEGLKVKLQKENIKVVSGLRGNANSLIKNYLKGTYQ